MDIKKLLYVLGLFLFFNFPDQLEAIIVKYGNRKFDIFKKNNVWIIASETKDGVEIAKNTYEFGHNFLVDLALTMEIAKNFEEDFKYFQRERTKEKVKEIFNRIIQSSYLNLSDLFNYDIEGMIDDIFNLKLKEVVNEFKEYEGRIEKFIGKPYEKIFSNEKTAIHALVGIIENAGMVVREKIKNINLENCSFVLGDLIKIYPLIGEHTINFEKDYPNIYHEDMLEVWKERPGDWFYLMSTHYIKNNLKFINWKQECKKRKQSLINKIEKERDLKVRVIYDPERFKKSRLPW